MQQFIPAETLYEGSKHCQLSQLE